MKPLLACLLLIVSCSPAKKLEHDKQRFARISVAHPEIPAQYCATIYPCKDSIIRGKDSITVDTLWGSGEVIIDTVYNLDTVLITKYLPGKTIREIIIRTDTIYQTDKAALSLCQIERRQAIANETVQRERGDKWERRAKKRFWIIAGMGAVGALWLFFALKRWTKRPN